jgi:hypothetical protein
MISPVTAISELSQQVSATLREVRSEIGELKCEFKSLRNTARAPMLTAAEAIIKLQFEKVSEDFQQQLDKKEREKFLSLFLNWAILTISQQTQSLADDFQKNQILQNQSASYLESLISLATDSIRTQIVFIQNLSL